MAFVQLTLETLKDLDFGKVNMAFMSELKRAVLDCTDRPGETKARSVALEFTITPIIDEDGMCESVRGEMQIKSKVPVRKTKRYEFAVNKHGHLSFSEHNPTSIDQTTFDDIGEDGKVRRGQR